MNISEISESLVGKRVRCIHGGCNRTGVITGIIEERNEFALGRPICSKGVKIRLDKPVFFSSGYGVQHTEWYEYEFESTARVLDGFGNLKYTELIEEDRSPIIKQFCDLKEKYPDRVLLFCCGDFYEAYEEDAEVCAKVLGITLTTRLKDNVKMAGFPCHALDMYLPKLIATGRKIAICDQIEEVESKKPARRTISDIVGK